MVNDWILENDWTIEDNRFAMAPNPIVRCLQKPASEFTKKDIIHFVYKSKICRINFMYVGGDGRLKTLYFVINDMEYLDTILTCGERVDGSSLFDFIDADSSDLYVVPRFNTAFIHPLGPIYDTYGVRSLLGNETTLCMLCSYFDKDGNPLASAPEQTLIKAMEAFKRTTGMDFHAMAELEYYVTDKDRGEFDEDRKKFPAEDQHGYHESIPFTKTGDLRVRSMEAITMMGGKVKYGHSEVGNFKIDGWLYEQNEIEFLPTDAMNAAEQILLAKWIIRSMAQCTGREVSFAPKITTGKAGSGLHIHMQLMKDGRNMMLDNGQLSQYALKAIAGMMDLAPSITAFGNKNPTSYFRLVPHQEAPTNICWGDRNRSVLVRVPLGWTSGADMCRKANPLEPQSHIDTTQKQTVEMRSPDGSADIYQLLAGLCVACRHGFEMENALDVAKRTYVDVNIHDKINADKLAKLATLPDSCAASADCLERQRAVYEQHGVFSPTMIDGIIAQLRGFDDRTLRSSIQGNDAAIAELVRKYFHCG